MDVIQFATSELGLTLSLAQETSLRATYGLPLSAEQTDMWHRLTGRQELNWLGRAKNVGRYPGTLAEEATFICGRRSGKSSRVGAVIAAYELTVAQHTVPPREVAFYLLCAPVESQARQIFDLVVGYVRSAPNFKHLLPGNRAIRRSANEAEVQLSNQRVLRVVAGNPRTARGGTALGIFIDEACHFISEEGTNNLSDLLEALRPSLLTMLPGAKLVMASTPTDQSGPVWEAFSKRLEESHAHDLIVQCDSLTMNPAVPKKYLQDQRKKHGEAYYRREFLAQFSDGSASAAFRIEDIDAAVMDHRELPPRDEHTYFLAIDAASTGDDFTCAVSHSELNGSRIVVDTVRRWQTEAGRPHQTGAIFKEIAILIKNYGIRQGAADGVSFAFVSSNLEELGVECTREITLGDGSLPLWRKNQELFADKQIRIPNDETLRRQLMRMSEFVKGRNITITARGKDDCAVVCGLAAWIAWKNRGAAEPFIRQIIRTGDPNARTKFEKKYGSERLWAKLGGRSSGLGSGRELDGVKIGN